MNDLYDAVIVGAGPAGLSAGIVLARNGLRVLLCDHRSLPIDRPCGEGILPIGLRHLQELGVTPHLDLYQTHPFYGIRFRNRMGGPSHTSGDEAAASFTEGPGLGVRRLNLSSALLRTAEQWPNLQIVQSQIRFETARHEPRRLRQGEVLTLSVRLSSSFVPVRTRLLIGADGLHSQVRRWSGLDGGAGRWRRLGARQHFAIAPWSDFVEVTYGLGIEAYVTPAGPDQVGVAFLWDADRHTHRGPTMIATLLDAFPELMERLRGRTLASAPLATGPLYRRARGRITDGVLLIGDAGGYLDACTGEGISLALAQALSLEQTVVPLLRTTTGVPGRASLANYQNACRLILRPYLLSTHLMLFLGRHPALFARFVRSLGRNPDILQHLLSAQMGCASFWLGWSKSVRFSRDFFVH